MSIINRISYYQGRRDEVPNQELACELAEKKDVQGIKEIAENLWNKNSNVQADCLKVLYETGYLAPSLIKDYWNDFLKLLHSRNNRLVWGAMIALGVIGELQADALYEHHSEIISAMEKGSVITIDNGVKALAGIAAVKQAYNNELFPYLLNHLATCRPKDVPQHAEKTLPAVNAANKAAFIETLQKRMEDMTASQAARIKKVIKEADKR